MDPTEPIDNPPPLPEPCRDPSRPTPTGPPGQSGYRCPTCGYDLTGATIGGACPECGRKIDFASAGADRYSNATNGMAIASLVCGILGLVTCPLYGLPTLLLAPLSIIFGVVARGQIRDGGYSDSNNGMATAGIVCSTIALGLIAMGVICLTGLFVMGSL